jgi:dCMP deaminase
MREDESIPSGERHELCRGLHAEQNAIIQAAYYGIPIAGAVLYCTNFPCVICSKMLINAGIRTVYYENGYNDLLAKQMLLEAGVELQRLVL